MVDMMLVGDVDQKEMLWTRYTWSDRLPMKKIVSEHRIHNADKTEILTNEVLTLRATTSRDTLLLLLSLERSLARTGERGR